MKKAILVFLSLVISLSALAAQEIFNRENFSYKVIGQSITITKYTGNDESVQIPASIGGLPVTAIGDEAFFKCYSLTSVTIPSSVTTIGNCAFFGCSSLTGINVEARNSAYMSITGVLFDKSGKTLVCCPAGKNGAYTIPSSVTAIGSAAFSGCDNLTRVTIPSSVTAIGNNAFSGCTGLKTVTIPSSVTVIGNEAFYGCKRLTRVTIPSSVTVIGDRAFYYCDSLTGINVEARNSAYMSIAGVLFDKGGKTLVYYPAAKSEAYTIPSSVITIGDGAFFNCNNLISVTIPSSVTTIGNYAFLWCHNLTSVTLSRRTNVGKDAFDDGVLIKYCARPSVSHLFRCLACPYGLEAVLY